MSQTSVFNLKLMVDLRKRLYSQKREKILSISSSTFCHLPLATVVNCLYGKGMAGCLESIHESYWSLPRTYFEPTIDKYSASTPSKDAIVPRLSLNETPTETVFYKCPKHNFIGPTRGQTCPEDGCSQVMARTDLIYINTNVQTGFVKAAVPYMVMDDLAVLPMTNSVPKYHVNGFDLEEKIVKVGLKEGLEILKASFETKAVLTTVFLAKDV